MSTRLYVEGGGDSKALRTACREGFRKFIEKAGMTGRMPPIIACGGRQNAYESFATAHAQVTGDGPPMLLADAEEPVTAANPWEHLGARHDWTRPAGASDDQCHLMVQIHGVMVPGGSPGASPVLRTRVPGECPAGESTGGDGRHARHPRRTRASEPRHEQGSVREGQAQLRCLCSHRSCEGEPRGTLCEALPWHPTCDGRRGRMPDSAPSLFPDESTGTRSGPVECLGMTFESDEARRAYFLEKLREKLRDPEFRKIEGFPVGDDEDILALSDPPYYTGCPNPFIPECVRRFGRPYLPAEASAQAGDPKEPYYREPFAADVSEGKADAIYTAHSYHTKVPHKAIMRYILHYTEPGDLVFDGFCGTGMTGVAAQACGAPDPEFKAAISGLDLEVGWLQAGAPGIASALPKQGQRGNATKAATSPNRSRVRQDRSGHSGVVVAQAVRKLRFEEPATIQPPPSPGPRRMRLKLTFFAPSRRLMSRKGGRPTGCGGCAAGHCGEGD